MRGTVLKHWNNSGVIWILGEDGIKYFSHEDEFISRNRGKKAKKGREVTFRPIDEGKSSLRAVKVDFAE